MQTECVQERVLLTREPGDWHIVLGEFDSWFTRILCGQQDGSGINLPGPSERREPTCPSCMKASRLDVIMAEEHDVLERPR